ncbi:MAG: hypothetical protein QOJ86_3098 [Bradyrhizobium sp.]|jgi:hypothetical protein|nr:hypothetical protein [Bradyrhizobium sp.]
MWRKVFQYAGNPEVFLDRENVLSLVSEAGWPAGTGETSDLETALTGVHWIDDSRRRWSELLEDAKRSGSSAELERAILIQSVPFAATLGGWLQGLTAPGVFEDPIYLRALALLADDVGVGRAEWSRYDAFRFICHRRGISEHAVGVRDIHMVREIRDEMFELPAILLALSRRSDHFSPEIFGIDVAFRWTGLLPAWESLARGSVDEPQWNRLNMAAKQTAALPEEHSPRSFSREIAEEVARTLGSSNRICRGIAWGVHALHSWDARLRVCCEAAADPTISMAMLLQERAREASAYHGRYQIEGKSLSKWFKEATDDPLPLVHALAKSRLVRPGQPDRSALVTTLLRSDGPMFRIFRGDDVELIRRWIASIDPSLDQATKHRRSRRWQLPAAPPPRNVREGDFAVGYVPSNIREAYYLLQGRSLAPRSRDFAEDYVLRWLVPSQRSIGKTSRSLPDEWYPDRLRTWLLDAHDRHNSEFESNRHDDIPAREEVIDSTLQLAPLTLIDGSWLQGFTDISLASTRVGFRLFETYWDELGNGQYELNHPRIYREVLRSMGIELAPTTSIEFATDHRIRDESFRLPVYWLCLGKLPVSFRAEILGMNLAMELSGVGGSYRSAKHFLQHYGFQTLFVDIHNTIDNVSTGHSAWAAAAIDAHMQQVREFGGVEAAWERVRIGYESLAPITRRKSALDYFKGPASGEFRSLSAEELLHHQLLAA